MKRKQKKTGSIAEVKLKGFDEKAQQRAVVSRLSHDLTTFDESSQKAQMNDSIEEISDTPNTCEVI